MLGYWAHENHVDVLLPFAERNGARAALELGHRIRHIAGD
jgi:hypothetical protein